jgi:hypothetical protein
VPGATRAAAGISQSRPTFTAPSTRPEAASTRARRAVTPRHRANSPMVNKAGGSLMQAVYRVRHSFGGDGL